MKTNSLRFLPTTPEEIKTLGWDRPEVILITGDAYVDHPSFGVSIVGRFLESLGVKVAIIANPNPEKSEDFLRLGEPTWFFGVTAGNLDSMLMKTTANKLRRSDDSYIPGGMAGHRPKRATIAYCNKLRELFKNPQILIGGIEASLRRFAHYDYWDNKVRRSLLLDTRADLLVYGMAEKALESIVHGMRSGKRLKEMQNISGTALMLSLDDRKGFAENAVTIPSYEEVVSQKPKYSKATQIIQQNQNPYSAKTLFQKHGNRYLCVFPPSLPLTEKEMDNIYDLPFSREPHPSYTDKIPAYEMIRFSVTCMRGCFGGCAFCALTVHQGKIIQNRSEVSIVDEIKKISLLKGFTGFISDVGGPTANMYKLGCTKKEVEKNCKKPSCVYPGICENLDTNHGPLINMLRKARAVKKIKKVFISSGIRHDLANRSPEYIRELAQHHVSGQLKLAPEHSNRKVLSIMRKPGIKEFEKFKERFLKDSKNAGLEQYIVPYFISSHPGCTLDEQVEFALYLKVNALRPRQVQEFIAAPMTLAADMYYTESDPLTGKKIVVPKGEKERRLQKALMQYFKPENKKLLTSALKSAGKEEDLKKLLPHLASSLRRYKKKGAGGRGQVTGGRKRKR